MSAIIAEVKTDDFSIRFRKDGHGMPDEVLFNQLKINKNKLVFQSIGSVEMELEDRRIISPSANETEAEVYEQDGATYVLFANLPWKDTEGNLIPEFTISFRHEIWPDGTLFTSSIFHAETPNPPMIRNFTISNKLDLKKFDDVRWSVLPRPVCNDSTQIQSASPERFIERNKDRIFDQTIIPLLGFNASRSKGTSLYAEVFIEGENSISEDTADCSSKVIWEDGAPKVIWNFQNKMTVSRRRPWQWRNQWGWSINPAPVKRNLTPQTLYHFIDNYTHYPTNEALEAIVESQCGILIIHSNWRRDAQNDGIPYDVKRLREIIDFAHKHDIRAAFYIRGNEKEIQENAAAWFDQYLKKDYDGLYMDYGGATGILLPADENFPNGSVGFRKHYLTLRRLRDRIGKNGIFFSHTGPGFSALGMSLIDAYVSGEGERGILLKGRKEYEYFTMVSAATGSLWSAAFPEYSSEKMIPFIASSGQYPHSPLGIQFKSSSLAHPSVPGINDLNFRPLWKLWSLFRHEQSVRVFCDYNSEYIFTCSSSESGHYLMISEDNERALLLISNFAEFPLHTEINVNWNNTGFSTKGKKCWRLTPDFDSPGIPGEYCAESFNAEFSKYPVEAFLISAFEPDWSDYLKDYYKVGNEGREWQKQIDEQRKMRHEPNEEKKLFLSIGVDNSIATSLEDSNYFDLHNNTFELLEFMEDGSTRTLGEIGCSSFYPEDAAPPDDYLLPGTYSRPLALHEILEPGFHRLGIQAKHFGEAFYSFISLYLTKYPADKKGKKIDFYNDLEQDRSFLTWDIIIK